MYMKSWQRKMKISSKLLITAVLAAALPACIFAADIVEENFYETATPAPKKTVVAAVTPKPSPAATAKPSPAPTIKPAATPEPAVKTGVSPEAVAELKVKLEDLNKAVAAIKDEMKLIEEKNIEAENVAKDLELYKKNLEDLQNKNIDDEKKVVQLEKSFSGIQDTLKNKMDKMSSWDDILDVLKKGISNNELEIARLKKEINILKKQYGGGGENIFDTIAQWPYAGFVALIVAIAAFVTVVVK